MLQPMLQQQQCSLQPYGDGTPRKKYKFYTALDLFHTQQFRHHIAHTFVAASNKTETLLYFFQKLNMIWARRYLQLFFSIVMMRWRMDGVSALVVPLQPPPVSMTIKTTTTRQQQQQPSPFHVPATTTYHDRCRGRRQPVRVLLSLLASADGPAILDRPTTTTTVIEKKREQRNEWWSTW
jgi:hypothetical protein